MKKVIQKAGAIILSSTDKNKVALLYCAGHKDWSFPKGHIELGESAEIAMFREIKEETGLSVKILKELPDLEYNNYSGEDVSTKMFLVESEDDSELKPEFEGDEIKWFTYDEVIEKLTYDNLKEYFKNVLVFILNYSEHDEGVWSEVVNFTKLNTKRVGINARKLIKILKQK